MKRAPTAVPTDVVRALARERAARGLSQAELGRRVGINQSHISLIERGLTDPQVSTMQNLAGALGLSLMLIPRALGPAVSVLARESASPSGSLPEDAAREDRPLYRLADEDDGLVEDGAEIA